MASVFRQLFDSIIDALGGGYDKPQPRPQPPLQADAPPQPKVDTWQLSSFYGYPITAADCRVCGVGAAKPEYYNQFCSYKCERRMSDSMDAWHDQFEERFGDD